MITIRMLKICGDSILKPLELIFKSCLENGKFPNEWKKANVVPVHKRNNKQLIENYRPISLLPVCGKILERLIYNKMFEFFTENELISQNQSGFKPGDSCISQLLCITHDIYQSIDDGLETRADFLDVSKAFDKVWHEGLLFKLQQNGISGNLLNVITNFLYQRKQRVVLNGQHSCWTNVQAGVPQGFILGPLFILSDLYQWLIWWRNFKSKIICGWHLSFLRCSKYKLNSKRSEQGFNENKWLGFPVENEVQCWP